MKFKSFYVLAVDNKTLFKAMIKHGEFLGYKVNDLHADLSRLGYFRFYKNGIMQSCVNPLANFNGFDELSLEDFFKLTPEDVRVEPERFLYNLYDAENNIENQKYLTQDQIDRIKTIMEES